MQHRNRTISGGQRPVQVGDSGSVAAKAKRSGLKSDLGGRMVGRKEGLGREASGVAH